jgi:hypothetical protein
MSFGGQDDVSGLHVVCPRDVFAELDKKNGKSADDVS